MRKKDGGVVQMRHEILAKKIVEESVVLLKNEEQYCLLPKTKRPPFLAVHSLSLIFPGMAPGP